MSIVWKLPNEPPDYAALERMKQHFYEPSELMPEAWFMGPEIRYYTWLAEISPDRLATKQLADAMHEIAGGIVAFPEVEYVSTWQAWFKYLLPYAIAIFREGAANEILVHTLTAFISVYPKGIIEEYEGFRKDIIYTLGASVKPYILSADGLDFENIFDYPYLFPEDGPRIYDDFSVPMLFGLKYLEPLEIEDWVRSIFSITNHAWRFALIGWWLTLHQFLRRSEDWPLNGSLETLVDTENGLVQSFWISQMRFATLHEFIPQQNLVTFQNSFAQHLTFEVFQSWATDILSRQTFYGGAQLPEEALEIIKREVVINQNDL